MRTDGQIKNKHIYFLDRHENVTGVVSTEATDETTVPLLSAKTNEELGSYDVIELEILANHSDSIQIPEDGSIVYHDEFMGWREYHITKLVDSDKDNAVTKEITGELSSVELLDAKFENSNYLEGTVGDMATKLLEGTRFTLGRFDFGIRSINLGHKGTAELKHKSVLECLYFIAGKADCDMYFSYKVDGNKVYSRQVNFIKKLGDDNGKRFEVGKDVNSVTREIDYSNVKTAIIPTGDFEKEQKEVTEDSTETPVTMSSDDSETGISDVKKELTIENVVWKKPDNPTDKPKGQKFLADLDSLARWGRKDSKGQLIHSFVHVHFSIKDDKELAKMAWVELGKYKNPKITYELDVMDLYNLTGQSEHKHENVVLGDVVSVIDRYFPKPMAVKSRVMKIERDLIDPTNNKVTLGDLYQTYTSQAISNESMIAGKLDDLVDKTEKVVTAIVTDRQTNNYGSTEPVNPKKGDLWFRPHPQKPGENQMLIWDGVQWVVQLDTSVNTDAYERTKDIEKDLEQSKQEILDVREQAEKGIEKANQNIKAITNETKEELARVQADASKALQESNDLLNGVSIEMSEQNKEIAEVKAKADKALQEGTELLSTVDGLKETVTKQGLDIEKTSDNLKVKADKTTVDSLKQTVDKQGTELAVTKDSINLKADKSQVNALDKTVKQQASELTVQSEMIKAQASKVDGNSTQLANLKLESDRLSSTVSKTENAINNMRIGTANYIKYSDLKTERSFNHFKHTNKPEFIDGVGVKFSGKEDSSGRQFLFTNEVLGNDFQSGDPITFSVKFKLTKYNYTGNVNSFFVRLFNSDNSFSDLVIDLKDKEYEIGKEYQESVTGVISDNFESDKPLQISLALVTGVELITKEWQIEKSTVPSDWKPSFKDYATSDSVVELTTKIEQTNKDILLKADRTEVNNIKKTVDKQSSEIKIANDSINLKADKTQVNTLENTVKKQTADLAVQSDKIQAQASKVDNNTTQLSVLKLQSDSLNSTISKTNTKLDNMKIGTANYIKLSDLKSEASFNHFRKNMKTELLEGVGVKCLPDNPNGRTNLFTFEKFGNDFQVGDSVTLSVKFKILKWDNRDKYNTFYARFFNVNGSFKDVLVDLRHGDYQLNREYQESGTYVIPEGFDFEKPVEISVALFSGIELITKEWQLEKSTIMSDWKPSFKDIVQQTEFSTFVQTSNSFQQAVKNEMTGFTSNQVQLSNQITSTVEQMKSAQGGLNLFTNWHGRNVKEDPKISNMLSISVGVEADNYYTISSNYIEEGNVAGIYVLNSTGEVPKHGANNVHVRQARTLLTKQSKLTIVIRDKDVQEDIVSGKYYIQVEKGKAVSGFKPAIGDTATKSQITQLSDQISAVVSDNKNNSSSIHVLQGAIQSTVKKGDVISSINQSPEKITLDAKRIHITGETIIDNAAIRSAAIRDLSADKIITGTLDARQVRVIGLDAGSIATGTLDAIRIGANSITADKLAANAIQVGFNNMGKNIKISPTELSFYRDGTLTGKVTDNGQEYWYGSRYLGSTGETYKAGSPSVRGIGHQLNHQGDFISWSFKETASATQYTSMLLLDPKGKRTGEKGIHVQQPMWVSELATVSGNLRVLSIGGNPAITSVNTKTGIIFKSDDLTFIHRDKSYNMNNLFRLMVGIGTGSFAMPVSFASDGTANRWINFTI